MRAPLLSAIGLVAVFAAWSAAAQDDESSRLRAQLRQVTLQLRQLQDDQATIQAQKVAAEMERDSLKKELASARAELAGARRSGDRVVAVQAELSRTKDALGQATTEAQQNQAERDRLNATVTKAREVLQACQAKNEKLLKVGRDVLATYEKFDVEDAFFANEPFTGIARVDLENLAQDYSDRLDDGVFDPNEVRAQQPAAQKSSAREGQQPAPARPSVPPQPATH
jgi:hypothetical protein